MTDEKDKFSYLFIFFFFILLAGLILAGYGIIKVEQAKRICNNKPVIAVPQEEWVQTNADRKGLMLFLVNQKCGGWNKQCEIELREEVELFLRGVK